MNRGNVYTLKVHILIQSIMKQNLESKNTETLKKILHLEGKVTADNIHKVFLPTHCRK